MLKIEFGNVFSFRNWRRKGWGRELDKFRERKKKHDPFITGAVSELFETLLCSHTVTGKLNRYLSILYTRLEPLTAQVAENVWSVL